MILSATRSTGNDAIFPLALLRIAHWRTKIYADFSQSTRLVYSNIVAAAVAFGLQKVGEWRQTVPCSSDALSPSDQTVRICVYRSRTRFFWENKDGFVIPQGRGYSISCKLSLEAQSLAGGL